MNPLAQVSRVAQAKARATREIFFGGAGFSLHCIFDTASCLALMLLAAGCSSHPPLSDGTSRGLPGARPSLYSITCVIHGDGNYGYHDIDGQAHKADRETLTMAKWVAEQNPNAEVFIFYQKRRRHTLFVFPRRDGEFYHYLNGEMLAHESYWRNEGESRFAPEIALYHQHSMDARPRRRFFFYFGHEIPEIGGKGYDASYRNKAFTVNDLADGISHLKPGGTTFDLVVLSTCYNGTPRTVAALSPHTRRILASPGNLHLSYFDLRPFASLETNLGDGDIAEFAERCARSSFERLARDLQTEVTVAVYDINPVQGYVSAVDSVYNQVLSEWQVQEGSSMAFCDCAEDSSFIRPSMSEGVVIFHRAARFGRSAGKQGHSGWECPVRLIQHYSRNPASPPTPGH